MQRYIPKDRREPDKATLDYDAAVAEGRQIVTALKNNEWALGELADRVKTKYGANTLARFAEDIGVEPSTLERYRSVYRAWKETPGPAPESFAVAQTLQSHPNRAELVRKNPKLTRREARKIKRPYKGKGKQARIDANLRPGNEKFADDRLGEHI